MTTRLKVYELYARAGRFFCRTINNEGVVLHVLAGNIRQAYAVAYKRRWSDYAADNPVGILSEYRRGTTTLACGCHDELNVQYRDGIRAVKAAIAAHELRCAAPPPAPEPVVVAASTPEPATVQDGLW